MYLLVPDVAGLRTQIIANLQALSIFSTPPSPHDQILLTSGPNGAYMRALVFASHSVTRYHESTVPYSPRREDSGSKLERELFGTSPAMVVQSRESETIVISKLKIRGPPAESPVLCLDALLETTAEMVGMKFGAAMGEFEAEGSEMVGECFVDCEVLDEVKRGGEGESAGSIESSGTTGSGWGERKFYGDGE
ncbi:hypothetical protein B0A48_16959 [Cryoendolithus antarcticus]|uniref:Uncharacterized protein n=1 Tax=Cryoendolithus antarcticus TaxID=1507870 RepID=A0A1V8SCV8_9PEZI|nr:hypothetical protein B0A48_16959 [Cryoendolithus antarcticus]